MYHWMTQAEIQRFLAHLRREERSPGTLAKYRRDLLAFAARLPQGGRVDKEQVLAWKEEMARRYAPSTVNSMIAALNGFFAFQGWHGCRVKALRQQREIFREKARELDKGEYLALLAAARRRGSQRLYHVMQTLGATGIRVSELVFVTVEALAAGRALVHCKGKRRAVLLPQKLCRALQGYCRARGITAGPVWTAPTCGERCRPSAPGPGWRPGRSSHTTFVTCLPGPFTPWTRTWRSWPTCWATPA